MKVPFDWKGQRYFPISQYYKNRFRDRVHKISVSVVESCPNRLSNSGEGCIFCDQWGSAGNHQLAGLPLETQIKEGRERLSNRFGVNKFLVYFQSFTNTFTRLSNLERDLKLALGQDGVCGAVIGTRPDCLPPEIFEYLEELSNNQYLSVELGVQTFSDHQLAFLNRGHTANQSIDAIQKLRDNTRCDVGIHLIFGLPDETETEIISAAETVNTLGVSNVKLHNLHVLAGTQLERLYQESRFKPISLDEYAEKVIRFLEVLSPKIAVQRLAAFASRSNELIAPDWTGNRMMPGQFIINRMKQADTYQGRCYRENTQ